MELFLVQHGEAKTEAEDPERPLSERGVSTVERVASWASRAGVTVGQIRHSGKRRAEQTAEIFAEQLKPAKGVIPVPGLGPNDDVQPLKAMIESESDAVMLVGHMPFLGRLAGLLVTGNSNTSVVRIRNSGIVCLRRREGRWSVDWAIAPELILALGVGL